MASGQQGAVARQIVRVFDGSAVAGLGEGELLDRFLARRDETAFEALVARHGPMVLGVCRRLLTDPGDVEDAFQATFLVLVKKAASIRDRERLGNWLYGVAHRVSARARSEGARRRSRERQGTDVAAERAIDGPAYDDLGPVLHEELGRLPEKYRAPVVLCDLEGRTHEEAARLLSWPLGSVKGRLSRARDLLRERLTRRGLALGAGSVAVALARDAEAAVPEALFEATVRAAMVVAAGEAVAAGAFSATAAALAEGVVSHMFAGKLKLIAATLTGASVLVGGAGVMAVQYGGAGFGGTGQAANAAPKGDAPKGVPTKDAEGGSPAGFQAGADRLARERVALAQNSFDLAFQFYETGQVSIDRPLDLLSRLTRAKVEVAKDQAERIRAVEDQIKRLEKMVDRERAKVEVGTSTKTNMAEAELGLAEARYQLALVKAGQAPERGQLQGIGNIAVPAAPAMGGGKFGGGEVQGATLDDEDEEDLARDEKIYRALGRKVTMSFANDTPFDDVIKFIRSATETPDMPGGLPIYVDPQGLEANGKTMTSPIILDLPETRLKTGLRLVFKQLGLGYYVREGLVIVTSLDSPDYLASRHGPQPGGGGMMGGYGGMGGPMGSAMGMGGSMMGGGYPGMMGSGSAGGGGMMGMMSGAGGAMTKRAGGGSPGAAPKSARPGAGMPGANTPKSAAPGGTATPKTADPNASPGADSARPKGAETPGDVPAAGEAAVPKAE